MPRPLIVLILFFAVTMPRAEKIVPILKDGETAPTFMLPTLDDKRVSLRDFCGQTRTAWKNTKRYTVILSFMASYCVPCRHEIPQVEAYAKTMGEDVKILFVSVDTIAREQLLPFAEQMKITQTVLLDRYGQVMKKFGVQKLPSLFVLDRDGNVRYQSLNGFPPNTDIKALLTEEVAKAQVASAPPAPAAPPAAAALAPARKLAVLSALLAGKPEADIQRESGLTVDEIRGVRIEAETIARERWGVQ